MRPLCCAHGVGDQHGDGHRADAAGHRGDPARTFLGDLELHIDSEKKNKYIYTGNPCSENAITINKAIKKDYNLDENKKL